MSKYTIHISRCQWQNVSIKIEADDEAVAEREALEKAEKLNDSAWSDGDAENYYISETEED